MIEFEVVLIRDFFFIACPNSFLSVESLSINGDRIVNEIGILVNDLFNFLFLNKFCLTIFQMQNYFSSSFEAVVLNLLYFELSSSIGAPSISTLSLNSWNYINIISYYEGGIESNTELPNYFSTSFFAWILFRLLLHFLYELTTTATSDCPQIID